MFSRDQRLIIAGRVLIQLDEEMEEINDIGCIVKQEQPSDVNRYQFYSLLEDCDKNDITNLMKRNPSNVIEFKYEREPQTPECSLKWMYFYNTFDAVTGETDVVKMDTTSMRCDVIYKSKFQIQHMAITEHQKTM